MCFILKLSPLEPTWPAVGPGWLLDPHGPVFWGRAQEQTGKCLTDGGEGSSLFPWGYDQELFQNKQSTSQDFRALDGFIP